MRVLPFSSGGFGAIFPYLCGFFLALLFTILLNASSLHSFVAGRLTMTELGLDNVSADEAHYFAMINAAAKGSLSLGNTSLKEHRSDPNVSTVAPLLQGSLMRFFGLKLQNVILIGDIMFPFLGVLILFFTLAVLGVPVLDAAVTTLFSLSAVAWQRSVNPQISVPLLLLCIGLYLLSFRRSSKPLLIVQGLATALLVFVHVLYAEFVVVSELILLLNGLLLSSEKKRFAFQRSLMTVVPPILACALKVLMTAAMPSDVSVDTYRRLGAIASRLPAAPVMQLTVVVTLVVFFLWRKKKWTADSGVLDGLPILLLSGLLCLNQSVVSGFDLVFGLYFAVPVTIVLRIVWMLLLLSFRPLSLPLRRIVATVLVVPIILSSLPAINDQPPADHSAEALITWLAAESKTQVILASIEISNLVPVLTPHFVVFNQYAHFEPATDSELADRFLLEKSLFPIAREAKDPLFSWVFGLYAGNLAARTRTLCRLTAFLTHQDCNQDPRTFIVHQDALKKLEAGTIDRRTMLRKFQVDLIVSESELPQDIRSLCLREKTIGSYLVYRCTLSS